MAQPVWVLSVDLQTKTATFQTGLAEAARSARSAFGNISSGAAEMGTGVAKGSIDVRHSLGLVDNVIRGAHAQAMADLIRMYAQSALVMSTLPIAAAAAGLALIGGIVYETAEHVEKLKAAVEKLNNELTEQNTTGNNIFNQLNDQILKAEQHADELRNNHLAALKIQLALIDHQSMTELVKSFGEVEKAADAVFKDLQSHWYEIGSGSTGPAHALAQFKVQYDNLLSQGKDKDASDLLRGTLESAKHILALQKQVTGNFGGTDAFGANLKDANAYYAAQIQLRQMGVGYTKSEVQSQEALVTALEQQVGIETRVAALKKQDGDNAKTEYGNQAAARRSAAMKEAAQSQLTMGQAAIAGDKATADAQLTIHNASIEARLKSDLDFAQRDYQMKEAANRAEIAALNKSGADYANQLKALNDKTLVIEAQYEEQKAEMRARAAVAENARDITALEQGIREQIDGTQEGSAARLAAINAGIREEQARQLQNTSFYRDLMGQRVQVMREMAEQQAKLAQESAAESARHESAMGLGRVQQQKQSNDLYNSGHRTSRDQIVQQQKALADEEYAVKMEALRKQADGLSKSGNDYLNRLKAIQDKETELTQQHENQITLLKEKAEEARNKEVMRAELQFNDSLVSSMTEVLMRHKTFAQEMTGLGDQLVSGLISNAIKEAEAAMIGKEAEAAKAARAAYNIGVQYGGPMGMILGPAFAAVAFATVSSYNTGTDMVPGVMRGDTVPAMLTPGEGVVPGGVMDGLRNIARSGGFQQQPSVNVHVSPTYHVHALDGDSLNRVLTRHTDTLDRHFRSAMRKANH